MIKLDCQPTDISDPFCPSVGEESFDEESVHGVNINQNQLICPFLYHRHPSS